MAKCNCRNPDLQTENVPCPAHLVGPGGAEDEGGHDVVLRAGEGQLVGRECHEVGCEPRRDLADIVAAQVLAAALHRRMERVPRGHRCARKTDPSGQPGVLPSQVNSGGDGFSNAADHMQLCVYSALL